MAAQKKKRTDASFFDDVYDVVRQIPAGRVTSYGAIAHFLGAKTGARMVGWAMHGCPRGVPAHRVVNSAGLLTGKHHFKTPNAMENALAREGIVVVNNKVHRFSEVFWDPTRELL